MEPATVIVEGPGPHDRFKFNQRDAERYMKMNPGARIVSGVDGEPAMTESMPEDDEQPERKARRAAPENKAVFGPAEDK